MITDILVFIYLIIGICVAYGQKAIQKFLYIGFIKWKENSMLILDCSNYNLYFEDYLKEKHINFESQKEADAYYAIWIEGFTYATQVYY